MKKIIISTLFIGVLLTLSANNTFPTPNGNVGIGTTSPSADLAIVNQRPQLSLGSNSTNQGIRFKYHEINEELRFQPSNQDGGQGQASILTIERNGKVGIGTDTPVNKLHVEGNTLIGAHFDQLSRTILIDTNNGITSNNGSLHLNRTGGQNIKIGLDDEIQLHMYGSVGINTSDPKTRFSIVDDRPQISLGATESGNGMRIEYHGGDQELRIQASTTNGAYDTNSQLTQMTIERTGNVGIGTTSPTNKLDVNGTTETDGLIVGVGGDGGRMSYAYENASATLVMYDRDDAPAIRFRTSPVTDSESVPEHEVSIVSVPHHDRIKVNAGQFDVQGTIRAEEIIVESDWSDYVFEKDYYLAPLSEVEAHIEAKGHLPGIPSAAEIEANGAKLSELVTLQMAKIEELTLHLIEKEKIIEHQSQQLASILARLDVLEK